jgi:hypothetical protein
MRQMMDIVYSERGSARGFRTVVSLSSMASPPAPTLETARLLLRPLVVGDAPQAQLLFPFWEIVRYMDAVVPWPYPVDGVLAFYRAIAIPATVGIGTRDFVDALKAEPFEPFTFRATSVSLYQLGDFGVAQRKLRDLHRC